MRQTECYKRLPDKVQAQIKLLSKMFAWACNVSQEDADVEKFKIISYLDALRDIEAITEDEWQELYELITEDGDKSYEGN